MVNLETVLSILVVICVVTSPATGRPRSKRQASGTVLASISTAFQCPQSEGLFPVETDCRHFVACVENTPYMFSCSNRLVFDPQTQLCDRAGNVPGCSENPSNSLCTNNPGNPTESWKTAHPTICNAYLTCEPDYVHRRCEFCAEGTYFSERVGQCVALEQDQVSAACGQKQEVAHQDKVYRSLSDDCNVYQDNPYRPQLERVRQIIGSLSNNPSNINNINNFNRPVPVTNRVVIPYSVPVFYSEQPYKK